MDCGELHLTDPNSLTQVGFDFYRDGKVKRLSPTQFMVKTETGVGSFLVQLEGNIWTCDCNPTLNDCSHRYAAKISASTMRPLDNQTNEVNIKCRYCGSVDISACGFRYNAYGISKRYRCNECLRKFSIKYLGHSDRSQPPSEVIWLLAEIGMILTKLEDLIETASRATFRSQ